MANKDVNQYKRLEYLSEQSKGTWLRKCVNTVKKFNS